MGSTGEKGRNRVRAVVVGAVAAIGAVAWVAPAWAALTIDVTAGVLTVTGDAASDTIVIGCPAGTVRVSGVDTGAACSSITSVVVNAGDGNDLVHVRGLASGAFTSLTSVDLNGEGGSDTFDVTTSASFSVDADGGAGADVLVTRGTMGADTIVVTGTAVTGLPGSLTYADVVEVQVSGLAGADALSAVDGNVRLDGGDDGDVISGGSGSDLLIGKSGPDQITGGAGNDFLRGGYGADTLNAQDGEFNDGLNGGKGLDTCVADGGDAVTLCEA